MMLTHRCCSSCIYWVDIGEKPNKDGVLIGMCEKQSDEKSACGFTMTTGGDKCGQWKKIDAPL